jgi:hypothetical protein
MAKVINASGEYTVKSTGESVGYKFEYPAYEDLQDAVDTLGEDKVFKLVQRMTKVDASNTARESAKMENGHSARKAMTEEQKAEAKAERASNKALLDKIKGLSAEQRRSLGL